MAKGVIDGNAGTPAVSATGTGRRSLVPTITNDIRQKGGRIRSAMSCAQIATRRWLSRRPVACLGAMSLASAAVVPGLPASASAASQPAASAQSPLTIPDHEGYSQSRVNSLESTQSIGAPK